MQPCVIQYARSFRLPAPPETVWYALARFDRYEEWWSWLRELRVAGEALEEGVLLDATVVPPLPYRMRVQITLVESVPPQLLRAAVGGDLRGRGRLLLRPVAAGTRADIRWDIEIMQRPMRLAARMARPVVLWAHERVVEATVASFRRHLAAPVPPAATGR